MFNQDEGKIECAVETGRYDFGRAKRPKLFQFYFWDSWYFFCLWTIATAKFKQLDYSCSLGKSSANMTKLSANMASV